MEIGFIAYALYASFILIWCSVRGDPMESIVISPALLRHWRESHLDVILFDLYPHSSEPFVPSCGDFLAVTPASLLNLIDWIPPGSTIIFRNRGVSSRCVQEVQRLLAWCDAFRVFWLDDTAEGWSARAFSRDTAASSRLH